MSRHVDILFFDMNSFFASVFQAEEPALRGRPVGIVTTLAPGAACIAASLEAKRRGVGMGVRIADAERLCPGIVFRPARHDMFVAYHHRIRHVVETIIPIDVAHSVDEFSCRLTGTQRHLDTALQLGRELQQAILERISPALTCSVGVAPNKLLAKIAAEMQKPSGLNWLTADVLPGKIAHLKLGDVPGISDGMLARLDGAGIGTVTALHDLAPKAARHLWHNVEGERFIRQLRGETVILPETIRSSLGHGQRLTPINRSPEAARLVARRLLVKAASRLRREGYFARSLSVSGTCAIAGRRKAGGQIMPTQDSFALLAGFHSYWSRLALREPVAVGIMLGGLQRQSDHVADLFETRAAGQATPREALCLAIDGLNQRFGQDTVRFGELPPHKVPYTGAKIAFGRIPEQEEFNE